MSSALAIDGSEPFGGLVLGEAETRQVPKFEAVLLLFPVLYFFLT
jgi:hypothetical protein